jgi:deoxyribodipyrimidine photo-lyase
MRGYMEDKKKKALFWFRRDLRLSDNCGLYHALVECDTVACVFIYDKNILKDLPKNDARVNFIMNSVNLLRDNLKKYDSDLILKNAYSEKEIVDLAVRFDVDCVYTNEDYEPQAIKRDYYVKDKLWHYGIEFKSFKDHVIFAKKEITNSNNSPFSIFTYYKNIWKKSLTKDNLENYDVHQFAHKFAKFQSKFFFDLKDLGFEKCNVLIQAGEEGAEILLNRFKSKFIFYYKVLREMPYVGGVSFLSVHNRFGTISIRRLFREAINLEKVSVGEKKESCNLWIDELIWREFYIQLMYNFPHVIYEPFLKSMQNFKWKNDLTLFSKWCNGETGYPIIDAAMKQLNQTGYMPNRLRMLTASFLVKNLLIDYRFGEQYFAVKLIDYDLAANNGGWQWVASTGCDSVNYLRIFNPIKQSKEFDPDAKYIKKYLPIFEDVPPEYLHEPWKFEKQIEKYGIYLNEHYCHPIIDYEKSRKEALEWYENQLD